MMLGLAPSLASAADAVQFEIEFFEGGASQPMNLATVWTSGRNVRIQQRAPEAIVSGPALIYRGGDGKILSVSNTTQSYAQIERKLISLLGGNTRRARREVETQLNGLPKDQKSAFERLLGVSRQDPKMADKPVLVERTGQSGDVAGFACEKAILKRAERLIGHACIAPWNRLGITQADMEVFRDLANFQRDALGNQKLTPLELVPNQPLELIVQFDGLPLSFERTTDGQTRSEIRVRSVKFISSSEALFEAPADYTERSGMSSFLAFLKPRPATAAQSLQADPTRPAAKSGGPADSTGLASSKAKRASAPAAPAPSTFSSPSTARSQTSSNTGRAAQAPARSRAPVKRIQRPASSRRPKKVDQEYPPITLF